MTFWDFAHEHWIVVPLTIVVLLTIVDNMWHNHCVTRIHRDAVDATKKDGDA